MAVTRPKRMTTVVQEPLLLVGFDQVSDEEPVAQANDDETPTALVAANEGEALPEAEGGEGVAPQRVVPRRIAALG